MASDEISDWLYCALLDAGNLFFSRPSYNVGQFELTQADEPGIPGRKLLAESAADWGETFKENEWRMKALFVRCSRVEAKRLGDLYAKETIALFNLGHSNLRPIRAKKAGYVLDLTTLNGFPFIRPAREKFLDTHGSTTAFIDEIAIHPIATINTLLSAGPEAYGELGMALRRSTHWSSVASQMDDYGETMLMHWMACETLCRVEEQETLAPKMMAAIGLPRRKHAYFKTLPKNERVALARDPALQKWSDRLVGLLDRLRDARNKIAHTGFRELELMRYFSEEELLVLRRILPRIIGGLMTLALNALHFRHKTIKAMWDNYSTCILLHKSISLAAQLKGTTLYQLDDPKSQMYEDF